MTTFTFTESIAGQAVLDWQRVLGYGILHGPDIAAGMLDADRGEPNCRDVVLEDRLCQVLVPLNPDLPPAALRGTQFSRLISGEFRLKDAERIAGIA